DGREIARVRKRMAVGDRTVVLLLVVFGRPHLIVELEGLRFVDDDRGWCHISASFRRRLLERRQIHERLEHRSWLTPRDDRTVVLRLVVRAAANERENFTRSRI